MIAVKAVHLRLIVPDQAYRDSSAGRPERRSLRISDAVAPRRSVVRNTHMATVTSASNAPAPTPARAVTTAGEHEFLSTTSKIQPLPQTNPAGNRPVEDVSDFDGQNRYQQDIAAKSVDFATSLSYRDAANHGDSFRLDAVADHHQPPCQEIRPQAQTVPSRLCRWHRR